MFKRGERRPWLSARAQVQHATMVLGGWTFQVLEPTPVQHWSTRKYVAKNPQGEVVTVNSTLFTCVDRAWYVGGGDGRN